MQLEAIMELWVLLGVHVLGSKAKFVSLLWSFQTVDRKVTNQSESGCLFTTWCLRSLPDENVEIEKICFQLVYWLEVSRPSCCFFQCFFALYIATFTSGWKPLIHLGNYPFSGHWLKAKWHSGWTQGADSHVGLTLWFRSISGDTWLLFIVDAFILSEKKAIKG